MSARILIVDDDTTIRLTLRKVFEKQGHRTSEAITGVEALQLVRNHHFDLITMDMAMDQMDGVDTIAVIRSERDIPILVISAHLTDEIRKDIEAQGVLYCLEKPFSTQDVIALANRALQA